MQSSKSANRFFLVLLWIFVLAGVGFAIAWGIGWEPGAFGVLAAGAFCGIPLFHFAMHWPMGGREKSESEGKGRE